MTGNRRIRVKRQKGYGRGRDWFKKTYHKGTTALKKIGKFFKPVLREAATSALIEAPRLLNKQTRVKTAKELGRKTLNDTLHRARQQLGSGQRKRRRSRHRRRKNERGDIRVSGPGHWQSPSSNRTRLVQPV